MPRQDYQERVEARRERLENAAARAQLEGDSAAQRSHDIMDSIPFGQPILVGHYSEQRDRREREKAWNLLGKSVEKRQAAQEYRDRAAAVGRTGISSDDPEAIDKLREKRAALIVARDRAKEVGKILRAAKLQRSVVDRSREAIDAALAPLALTDNERAAVARQAYHMGWWGYSPDSETREIARIDQRIKLLEAQAHVALAPITSAAFTITDDPGQNRLVLKLSTRVERDVFQALRQAGWRWAPTQQAFIASRTHYQWLTDQTARILSA